MAQSSSMLPPHPFALQQDAERKDVLVHADECALRRWSARFTIQYLENRPWDQTAAFYKTLVQGDLALQAVGSTTSPPVPLAPGGANGTAGFPQAEGVPAHGLERLKPLPRREAESTGREPNGDVPERLLASKGLAPSVDRPAPLPPIAPSSLQAGGTALRTQEDGVFLPSTRHQAEPVTHSQGGVAGDSCSGEGASEGLVSRPGTSGRDAVLQRKTVKVELAYSGEYFAGFQTQRGLLTVQGALEVALAPYCQKPQAEGAKGTPWSVRRERAKQRRAEKVRSRLRGPVHGSSSTEADASPQHVQNKVPEALGPCFPDGSCAEKEEEGLRKQEDMRPGAEETSRELERATVFVAGRTDRGVSAAGQVCSFHTWQDPVDLQGITAAIDRAAQGLLRVLSASVVPREFHPAFSATWRRYAYLLPLLPGEGGTPDALQEDLHEPQLARPRDLVGRLSDDRATSAALNCEGGPCLRNAHMEPGLSSGKPGADQSEPLGSFRVKPVGVDAPLVDAMLRELVHRGPACYSAFARDTPAHRSSGPATVCRIFRAQARVVELPPVAAMFGGGPDKDMPAPQDTDTEFQASMALALEKEERKAVNQGKDPSQGAVSEGPRSTEPCRALLVELIADRFLRRMVRVLVATAVREAAAGAPVEALCQLAETNERRVTAPPAPPTGLCLIQVGYTMDLPDPL